VAILYLVRFSASRAQEDEASDDEEETFHFP
jgi:hypothetical protein